MTEPDDFDDPNEEPAAIGVGMGGSCPVCRAPVDLGQEFCLECGSPIRFTPRQRPKGRAGDRPTAGAPAPAPPQRGGFPWVPFLVVLGLIGGGVAFALVDGDDSDRSSRGASTEEALPSIDSSVPDTSTTETETVPGCTEDSEFGTDAQDDGTDPDGALSGMADPDAPPVDSTLDLDDEFAPQDDGNEQIPEVDDGSGVDPQADAFADEQDTPSVEPEDDPESGSDTVTVDEDGSLCPIDGSDDDFESGTDDPVDPAETSPDSTTAGQGSWPAGEEGWTVVVAGFDNRPRALQVYADLQEDGYGSDGGVLFSTDYPSLCPGIHVVFSGTFSTRAEADERRRELEALPDNAPGTMYSREVRTSGPKASCSATR